MTDGEWHEAALGEVWVGCQEKALNCEDGWALEQAPQEHGHSTKPAWAEVFGQCSQTSFQIVLCGAKSWTPWSLQVPFDSGYPMVL